MTVQDLQYAESNEQSETILTSYQDKTTLEFTPDAVGDYLILAVAEIQGTSTSYDAKARLLIGASIYQELIYRVKDVSDWYPFCALKRLNLSALTTIKIQWCTSNAGATARIRNARIIAFKVPSQYNEAETRTTTTSTTYVDKVALTFTPISAGDYLIIVTANIDCASASYSVYARLLQDGSVVHNEALREPGATSDRLTFALIRKVTLTAASHTFTVQYHAENASYAGGIGYAHIVAIRLDEFLNSYYNEVEAQSSPAAANTWYDKVTVSYTPQNGAHLVLGSIMQTSASTTQSVGARLNLNGSVVHDTLVEAKDTTDYDAIFLFSKADLIAESRVDKIQYMGEGTGTKVKSARIVSLQLTVITIIETITAKNFPMLYLSKPITGQELKSKVEGATITKVANDFPLELLKEGKGKELKSKWS